jgi:hypothetical protein
MAGTSGTWQQQRERNRERGKERDRHRHRHRDRDRHRHRDRDRDSLRVAARGDISNFCVADLGISAGVSHHLISAGHDQHLPISLPALFVVALIPPFLSPLRPPSLFSLFPLPAPSSLKAVSGAYGSSGASSEPCVYVRVSLCLSVCLRRLWHLWCVVKARLFKQHFEDFTYLLGTLRLSLFRPNP